MVSVDITLVSGLTPPYNIYVCDIYGNNCVLTSTIFVVVPPTINVFLPAPYMNSPAVMVKIIASNCCEVSEIVYCDDL